MGELVRNLCSDAHLRHWRKSPTTNLLTLPFRDSLRKLLGVRRVVVRFDVSEYSEKAGKVTDNWTTKSTLSSECEIVFN